ncbi:cytochrome b5 domain-containing protein [Candidatus Microgenomates bacterium]|nr:cytochrome b5 domain-containing protein [Candidatus Microgenomates bacterium]
MKPSIKSELFFGTVSILILSILIVVRVVSYNNQASRLTASSGTISIDPNTVLTPSEVSKHSSQNDCWIIIENKVYVVSDFLSRHPGGGGLITPYCGKDATQPFLTKDGRGSHSAEAFRLLGFIYMGDVNGKVIKQPDVNSIKTIQINTEDNDD